MKLTDLTNTASTVTAVLTLLLGVMTQVLGFDVVNEAPDRTRLAVGGDRGIVRIHDAATGQILKEMEGHTDDVHSVAWSLDGRTSTRTVAAGAAACPPRAGRCRATTPRRSCSRSRSTTRRRSTTSKRTRRPASDKAASRRSMSLCGARAASTASRSGP